MWRRRQPPPPAGPGLATVIHAWNALLPGWQPTPAALRALDEGPPEYVHALRILTRDWTRDDARWDLLLAVLEYTRQYPRPVRHGDGGRAS